MLPSLGIVRSFKILGVRTISTERIERKKKWWSGALGTIWKLENLERRNAYHRAYYAANREKRRVYLNAKQREYRSKKKGSR